MKARGSGPGPANCLGSWLGPLHMPTMLPDPDSSGKLGPG